MKLEPYLKSLYALACALHGGSEDQVKFYARNLRDDLEDRVSTPELEVKVNLLGKVIQSITPESIASAQSDVAELRSSVDGVFKPELTVLNHGATDRLADRIRYSAISDQPELICLPGSRCCEKKVCEEQGRSCGCKLIAQRLLE